MRISVVGPAFPLRGGVAHHVYHLCRLLRSRGHDVQVISYKRLYPSLFFPGRTTEDTSTLALDPGALPVLDSINPLSWVRAAREIRRFAPDGVVFEWWHSFFGPVVGTISRLVKRDGVRSIIECHNVLPHERNPLDLVLTDIAFAPVDCFITHSTTDREQVLSLTEGKRVVVAPLLSIPELTAESAGGTGRTILFFGLVRSYKGLDVLIRALPRVFERVECDALIAGEFYEPEGRYRSLIDELGIASRVRIENRYIPNQEVPSIFARAAVLVLPYRSTSQSGVARIALDSRLPIVASRTGGLAEVVQDGVTGLLFPPGDAEALAECLTRYFEDGLGPVFSANIGSMRRETADCGRVIEDMLKSRSGNGGSGRSVDPA